MDEKHIYLYSPALFLSTFSFPAQLFSFYSHITTPLLFSFLRIFFDLFIILRILNINPILFLLLFRPIFYLIVP